MLKGEAVTFMEIFIVGSIKKLLNYGALFAVAEVFLLTAILCSQH